MTCHTDRLSINTFKITHHSSLIPDPPAPLARTKLICLILFIFPTRSRVWIILSRKKVYLHLLPRISPLLEMLDRFLKKQIKLHQKIFKMSPIWSMYLKPFRNYKQKCKRHPRKYKIQQNAEITDSFKSTYLRF